MADHSIVSIFQYSSHQLKVQFTQQWENISAKFQCLNRIFLVASGRENSFNIPSWHSVAMGVLSVGECLFEKVDMMEWSAIVTVDFPATAPWQTCVLRLKFHRNVAFCWKKCTFGWWPPYWKNSYNGVIGHCCCQFQPQKCPEKPFWELEFYR